MIHINLLPVKAAQKKEKLKGQLIVALTALVVTVAVCALAYWQLLGWAQEAKDNVESKRQEIARLTRIIGEVNEYKKRQEGLRAKLDVLDKLDKSRRGPVMILDELYKALPDKLWLESFRESGGSVNLSGVATNEETVAVFMRNLDASPQFEKVSLGGVQQVVQDGVKLHRFSLVCSLEIPQPASPAAGNAPK